MKPGVWVVGLAVVLATLGVGAAAPSFRDEVEGLRDRYENGPWPGLEDSVRDLLARAEVDLGKSDPVVADVLDLLVQVLFNNGQRRQSESLELAQRAVDLRRQLEGERSAAFAASLHNLAALLADNNQRQQAVSFYEQALAITIEDLGRGSDQEARILEFLGDLLLEMDDFEQARALLTESLLIRVRHHGGLHPSVAKVLNTLAKVDYELADWDGAVAKMGQALTIFRATLNADNPFLLRGVFNLGVVYSARGDLEQARSLLTEALEGRRRVLGDYHPVTASTHDELGFLLQRAGELESARYHYQESSLGTRQGLGADHPSFAFAELRLAAVKMEIGDHEGAEARAREALSILERAYGDDHSTVGAALSRLGEISLLLGRRNEARRRLDEALRIQRAVLGDVHPDVAETLQRLALLEEAEGDLHAARTNAQASLDIFARVEDSGLRRIGALIYLARVAFLSGHDLDARGAVDKAGELLLAKKVPAHPFESQLDFLGALLDLRSGQYEAARTSGLALNRLALSDMHQTLVSLTEREALLYSGSLYESLSLLLSVMDEGGRRNQAAVESAFGALLRSRSLVVQTLRERHRFLRASTNERTRASYASWSSARDRLVQLILREARLAPKQDGSNLLDDARRAVERAEEELVVSIPGGLGGEAAGERDPSLDQMVEALGPGEALLSFALYDDYGGDPRRTGATDRRYVCFVVTGEPRAVTAVDLGPARELDASVDRLLATIGAEEAMFRQRGADLAQTLWHPLEPLVAGKRRLFVVWDGKLNLVNLYALPTSPGRYLIDSGVAIHTLETERDLVAPQASGSARGLLALGSPDFDSIGDSFQVATVEDESQSLAIAATAPRSLNLDASRGVSLLGDGAECEGTVLARFSPLPGTEREVRAVLDLWDRNVQGEPRTTLLSAAATEEAFRGSAGSKRILHLATHGFVRDQGCTKRPRVGRATSLLRSADDSTRPRSFSGLALAGANYLPGSASVDRDGILTTEEIGALDLGATQWAVLSACATGVGQIWAGEGVEGLQRAFRIAGVRSVIMSLWPVEDDATARWMSHLYQARLVRRLDTVEAVHYASAETLASLRKTSASTHPRVWAAFVGFGDWR